MNKDLTFGFIAKSVRSSGKLSKRKITIPTVIDVPDSQSIDSTTAISLTGIQGNPNCCYPLLQLMMHAHNQIRLNAHILHDDVSFEINIKSNEWLSRSRLAFSDYSSMRSCKRTGSITHSHLEELLTCLSTTLTEYSPYSRKRYSFSFLSAFSYSKVSDTYTLTFPVRILPLLDVTGELIQINLTERLLKRRAILFPLYSYLLQSNKSTHRVCELTKCMHPGFEKVRIMPSLIFLAEIGLISFVSDGRGDSRVIEELEIIPYAQRTFCDVLTIEEMSCAAT